MGINCSDNEGDNLKVNLFNKKINLQSHIIQTTTVNVDSFLPSHNHIHKIGINQNDQCTFNCYDQICYV